MPFPSQADGRTYAQFSKSPESPPAVPDNGLLYSKKDYGGTEQVELFYKTDAGVEYQLTPTSSGGGVTYDFVYDANATPAGNVYNDWDALYTAGSALEGSKRVYLQSDLEIFDEYALANSWEFIGVRGAGENLYTVSLNGEGFLVVQGASLAFRNCYLFAGMDGSSIGIAFEPTVATSLCFLFLDNVIIDGPANTDVYLFRRAIGETVKVIAFLNEVQDINWNSDGSSFVFSDIQMDIYIRFSRITSAYFFGGDNNAIDVAVDQSEMPLFPPGGDTGGGVSPFNNDNDSANFTWRRTNQYQQSVIQIAGDLVDFEMYAGNITDLVAWEPNDNGYRLRSLSTVNQQRAFDNINVSETFGFTIVHQDDATEGDFWCPNGRDFYVSPSAAFRIVRDPVNNVWRVLVPDQVNQYDLVYDSAGTVNQGNVFNDFNTLFAVGSQLEGMKRVWLKTDLILSQPYICNGGWTFEGLGASTDAFEPWGTRALEFAGDTSGEIAVEGDVLKFRNLYIEALGSGIRPDNTLGSCTIEFYRCQLDGGLAPVLQPANGDCTVVLDTCDVSATAGIGALVGLSGSLVVKDTVMGQAALKNSSSVVMKFCSGTLPFSTNNTIANWDDFEINVLITGNGGYAQVWTMAVDEDVIAPNGIDVLTQLTVIPSAPVELGSIQPPTQVSRAPFPLINAGAGADTLTLRHLDGAGAVGGLFFCPGAVPFVLDAGEACMLAYDPVNTRFVVIA